MSHLQLLFSIVVAMAAFTQVMSHGRFQNVYDDDDYESLEIDDAYAGRGHVFTKTCFPVTMEVCIPTNGTSNSTVPVNGTAWAQQIYPSMALGY